MCVYVLHCTCDVRVLHRSEQGEAQWLCLWAWVQCYGAPAATPHVASVLQLHLVQLPAEGRRAGGRGGAGASPTCNGISAVSPHARIHLLLLVVVWSQLATGCMYLKSDCALLLSPLVAVLPFAATPAL